MQRITYKHKKRRKLRAAASVLVIALLFCLVRLAFSTELAGTFYTITDERLPAAFSGYRIAHLSDLHCDYFGDRQEQLLRLVREGEPDLIVLTGDMLDKNERDYNSLAVLFEGLTAVAPVYAVSGNHERYDDAIEKQMTDLYQSTGVRLLSDEGVWLRKNKAGIFLCGMDYRSLHHAVAPSSRVPAMDGATFGILLFHRSDQFDYVSSLNYSLVLSGHTHGGLIRIPFHGGIITPDRQVDFNQPYSGGLYRSGRSVLIANRGLAGSNNLPRLFNRPEVVFVTLRAV